jgi:hypothetical protein
VHQVPGDREEVAVPVGHSMYCRRQLHFYGTFFPLHDEENSSLSNVNLLLHRERLQHRQARPILLQGERSIRLLRHCGRLRICRIRSWDVAWFEKWFYMLLNARISSAPCPVWLYRLYCQSKPKKLLSVSCYRLELRYWNVPAAEHMTNLDGNQWEHSKL